MTTAYSSAQQRGKIRWVCSYAGRAGRNQDKKVECRRFPSGPSQAHARPRSATYPAMQEVPSWRLGGAGRLGKAGADRDFLQVRVHGGGDDGISVGGLISDDNVKAGGDDGAPGAHSPQRGGGGGEKGQHASNTPVSTPRQAAGLPCGRAMGRQSQEFWRDGTYLVGTPCGSAGGHPIAVGDTLADYKLASRDSWQPVCRLGLVQEKCGYSIMFNPR